MKPKSRIYRLAIVLIFIIISHSGAFSQVKYWVNGSGNWNDTAHWSLSSGGAGGASVPTLINDVVFDKKSFSENSAEVTINAPAFCNNLTWKSTKTKGSSISGLSEFKLTLNGSLSIQEKLKNSFNGTFAFIGDGVKKISSKVPIENKMVFLGNAKWVVDENTVQVKNIKIIEGQLVTSKNVVVASSTSSIISLPQKISGPQKQVATVNIVVTNPSCNGGSNGNAVVTVTGGTPPYIYQLLDWTNFIPFPSQNTPSTTVTFNNLYATEYLLRITDATADPATARFFTVGQPGVLGLTVTPTNISCSGLTDGKITATPSGGSANFTYTLRKGGTPVGLPQTASGPYTFTGLVAGADYTVEVNDANSCGPITQGPISIFDPVALSGSVTAHTNILCFGASTGSITASASNGTTPYEYSIDGGAYQASGTFNGLAAGNHTVAIRDANLCSISLPVYALTQPATALASTNTATNVKCKGGSDGTLTSTATGGLSPYTYKINNIIKPDVGPQAGAATFVGLPAGSYTVTVTDANGCIFTTTSIAITEPAAGVSATNTTTAVKCKGGSDGTLTATALGGTSPYTYKINGIVKPDIGPQAGAALFTGLPAGSYTVTVTDANGCFITTIAASVSEPAAGVSAANTTTSVKCKGGSDGTITSTAIGGTANYTYSLTPAVKPAIGPIVGAATFTNLPAGSYTVTVTDANGCSFTTPAISVTEPVAALGATATAINVKCNGDSSGSITATATGGTANYSYAITPAIQPPVGPIAGSTTFINLPAGSYTITITDANSCSFTTPTITISQPATALAGSITSQTNVNCFGGNDGAVTVAGAGGTSPYQYSLNGSVYQASGTFTTLTFGAYTVTVKDANSCTKDVAVNITQPAAAITGSVVSQTNITCNGGSDGTVTVTASGGTTPYTYNIDGGVFGASPSFTNLTGTAHTVVVKDSNGCTFNIPFTLTEPAAIVISAEVVVNVTGCFGNLNGSITITASGGTGALSYSKNGGTIYQASGIFLGVGAGSYQIVVKDTKGCTKNGSLLVVTQPTQVAFTFTTKDLSCNGSANGEIHFTASGGTPPYQYSILGGTPVSWKPSPDFIGLAAGTYSLKVKDANNCTTLATVAKILQPAAIATDGGTWQDVTSCNGGNTGSISVKVTGGVPPFSFSINGGVTWQATGDFLGLFAGTYTVIVKDGNGCTTNVGPNTINEPSKITINSEIVEDVTICWDNKNGSIVVLASGGTGDLQFSIDGGTTWQTDGFFNTLGTGIYQVSVKDDNGCIKNGSLLTVLGPPPIVINTFTSKDITCFGSINGEIHATASGGTGTLVYSIDGTIFQGTGDFTGLAAGPYTLTVKDDNDCTLTRDTTIIEPASLVFSSQLKTDITCNGLINGTITLIASGGTPPYMYSITGGIPFGNATGIFTGLAAGIYNAAVIDSHGCITVGGSFTVVDPPALSLGIPVVTSISCFGQNNGIIQATASGGTSPYTYTLYDAVMTVLKTNSTGLFPDLSGGNYTVDVKDANGCGSVSSGVLTVVEPTLLTFNTFITDLGCHGDGSGEILFVALGGTPPYEYSTDGGLTFSSNDNPIGLPAGTYNLAVRDNKGCEKPSIVTITEPAELILTLNGFDVKCNGDIPPTGMIVATTSGGASPMQFRIDGGPWQASGTFNNVSAILHNVDVLDNNGCTTPNSVTINEPTPIVIDPPTYTDPTCSTPGTITVTATGGTGIYTYTLTPGGSNNTDGRFIDLGANSYTVSVSDVNSCGPVSTPPIVLTSPSLISIDNVIITPVTPCFGGTNGAITIVASGGTAPLSYSIDGGATTQPSNSFLGLPAGNYTVVVNDITDCPQSQPVSVNEPAQIVIDNVFFSQITAEGASDGSITVLASGTLPLTYTLLPTGTINGTGFFPGLSDNTYTVEVRDANNCGPVVTNPITLSGMSVIVTPHMISCFGLSDGSIDVLVQGGTPNYTIDCFQILPSGNITVLSSPNMPVGNLSIPDLPAGDYRIIVIDNTNNKDSTDIKLTEFPLLTATFLSALNPTCKGRSDGSVVFDVTGGKPAYTITWSGGSSVGTTATGLASGSYDFTITDFNGCFATVNGITLTDPIATLDDFAKACVGGPDFPLTGGLPVGGTYSGRGVLAGVFSPATAGVGIDTITYTYTDLTGCVLDTTNTIVVTSLPELYIPLYISVVQQLGALNIISILSGTSYNMDVNTVSNVDPTTFTWEPDTLFTPKNSWNSSIYYDDGVKDKIPLDRFVKLTDPLTHRQTDYIKVYAIATTSIGCTDTLKLYVKLIDKISFGNVFSPNGDGINDMWLVPKDYLFPDLEIEIFNRWGSLVWSAKGDKAAKGWNGRTNKGNELPIGTYYYVIKFNINTKDGNWKPINGSITIVR